MMCDSAKAWQAGGGPSEQGKGGSVWSGCARKLITTIMCCRDSTGQEVGCTRSPIRLQEKLKRQYWLAPLFHCSTLSIDPLIPLLPEQRFGVLLS